MNTPPTLFEPTTTQRLLSAFAVLSNCLTAGSISTFPLWSAPLARTLHLTSSQVNVLASSAILGEYATAATWGSIADTHGPGAVSISAGATFALGYGCMGLVAKAGARLDEQGREISRLLWAALCVTYFFAGAGVAASYFSAMISSTKSAPARHSGIAIGIPCAVFGLSPLFLSALASYFTTSYDRFPTLPGTSEMELDPGRWLLFLAAFLAIVNGVGGLFLKELPWEEEYHKQGVDKLASAAQVTVREDGTENVTERTHLLSARPRPHPDVSRPLRSTSWHLSDDSQCHDSPHNHHHLHRHRAPDHSQSESLRQFLLARNFWLFGSLILLSTGPVEMYIASLGQILESLLAVTTATRRDFFPTAKMSHALQARKNHIAILAIANTVSRLLVGAASDYLSRPNTARADDNEVQDANEVAGGRRVRRRISRLVFLLAACAALALVYAWGGTGLATKNGLWVITLVNGVSYGAIFTLAPTIVRSCWPVDNFGRNWGLLTWFSAIGALIFTPLFGVLRDLANSVPSTNLDVCASAGCYRPIFLISAISAGLSCGVVALLWKRWSAIV